MTFSFRKFFKLQLLGSSVVEWLSKPCEHGRQKVHRAPFVEFLSKVQLLGPGIVEWLGEPYEHGGEKIHVDLLS